VDLDLARQQWEQGNRRVEQARSTPELHAHLLAQVEVVSAELRRRVGQTFSLDALAAAYDGADRWGLEVLDDARAEDAPPPDPATAVEAAFHLYARGASDYVP
jgi:hypothetical protein